MSVRPDWFKTYQEATAAFQPFKTAKEAREACNNAYYSGSEEHTFALSRWIGLSLIEAERARTIAEASLAYENAPRKSEAERLARDKWDEYAIVDVRNAATIEEVEAAYDNARRDSKAAQVARDRWHKFILEMVEKAETIDECKELSERATKFSYYSEARKRALAKWNAIALPLVKRARTYSRACDVYELCPENSEAQKMAIEKVNALFTGEKKHGDKALYLKDRTVLTFQDGRETSAIMGWTTLPHKAGE